MATIENYEIDYFDKLQESLFDKAMEFKNSDKYTVFVHIYDEGSKRMKYYKSKQGSDLPEILSSCPGVKRYSKNDVNQVSIKYPKSNTNKLFIQCFSKTKLCHAGIPQPDEINMTIFKQNQIRGTNGGPV